MQIKMHPAYQLINYITHHTNLYIRGARGATIEKLDKLDKELYQQFVEFFNDLEKRGDIIIRR